MHSGALRCADVHRSAQVHCGALQCSEVLQKYAGVHRAHVRLSALRCTVVHGGAQRCTEMHRCAQERTVVHCGAQNCTMSLRRVVHRGAKLRTERTEVHRGAQMCTELHGSAL